MLNELLVHVLDMCFFLLSCHASSSRKKLTDFCKKNVGKNDGATKEADRIDIIIHQHSRKREEAFFTI